MRREPRPLSKRLPECHQPWLAMPGASRRVRDRALAEGLGLHLEVDLGVDVRGVERDVPEPGADRVDVHPGAQKVYGRRVADDVRADALGADGWHALGGLSGVARDQSIDSEARDAFAAPVEEDGILAAPVESPKETCSRNVSSEIDGPDREHG